MCDSLELIRKRLCATAQRYHAVAEGGKLRPREWMENVRLLRPIADELHLAADTQIAQCQMELEQKRTTRLKALDERAKLYKLIEQKKSALTALDAEVIGIMVQIEQISDDITQKQGDLENCQEKIRAGKRAKKKWNTVFWATCWIPLVNIGTGCKKADADADYYARAKTLGEEIDKLKARSGILNQQLKLARQKEAEKNVESAEITRNITAAMGRAAQLVTEINSLSRQIYLWISIRDGCEEIRIRLEHVNGDIEEVQTCFEELLKVEELLRIPSTACFMDGLIYKGTCIRAGECLRQNEYLMSPNRKYIAVLGMDNGLAVYNSEQELWSSGTQGAQGQGVLILDGHGPAVLRGTDRSWNTKRPGAVSLVMQDDGNLVAYDSGGRSLWATDTFTYADVKSLRFQGGVMEQINQINIIKGRIKMTDKQIALQCIQALEKYMAEVRQLPNDNSKLAELTGEDMVMWKEVYYPELSKSGKVLDAGFFEEPVRNPNTGIGQDGTFTKYEYVQFLWSAYKFVLGDFAAGTPALRYIKDCIAMLEPYIAACKHKGNGTEMVYNLNAPDKTKWVQDYYPNLSRTGMIPDGSFFGDVNQEPRYGIGSDGAFAGEELCHFLYRLYRQAYIMLN